MSRDSELWLRAVRRSRGGFSPAPGVLYNPRSGRWARARNGVWLPQQRLVEYDRDPSGNRHASHYLPACGFTSFEEDQIHHLMGRVRRGTLSRECLERALEETRAELLKDDWTLGGGRSKLESAAKVYEHVLRDGEFRGAARNPDVYDADGRDGTRGWRRDFDARWDEFSRDGARPALGRDRDGDWERDFDERWDEFGDDGTGVPVAANPQLQVIENPRRPRRRNDEQPPSAVLDAVELFHGSSDGEKVAEFKVDDGEPGDEKVYLALLGRCPFVSWYSKARGAKQHAIEVEGEYVKFKGFRPAFRGEGQPYLALDTSNREAVIVGGNVERLKKQCTGDPIAPVVEYIVPEELKKKSSKAGAHYVHEFDKGTEPKLSWDEEVNGLRYNGGSYVVSDWFHK